MAQHFKIQSKLIQYIFYSTFSAGAGIGIAGGMTGGAATISEKVTVYRLGNKTSAPF